MFIAVFAWDAGACLPPMCSLNDDMNKWGAPTSSTFLKSRCMVRPRRWPGFAKGSALCAVMYAPLALISYALVLLPDADDSVLAC